MFIFSIYQHDLCFFQQHSRFLYPGLPTNIFKLKLFACGKEMLLKETPACENLEKNTNLLAV